MTYRWLILALGLTLAACDGSSSGSGQVDGGSGGAGGTGGSGGAGGGDREQLGTTGFTERELKTVWLRMSSCGQTAVDNDYLDLVHVLFTAKGARRTLLQTAFRCVLEADDCATTRACSPDAPTDTACDDDTFEPRCDGDVYVYCGDFASPSGYEAREDCYDELSGNTTCRVHDGMAGCVSAEACDGPERCEGDVAIRCEGGLARRNDCSLGGGTCHFYAEDGYAGCVVAPTGCQPCDGNVANRCSGDVLNDRFDCSLLGLECQPEADGDGTCGAAEPECGEGNERCEGDVAEVCIWGKWTTFDCSLVGATCAARDDKVFCDQP